MTDLMTIEDIAGLHRCSVRHARDVMTLARISRHKDLRILLNTYYRESAEDIAARLK